MPIFEHDDEMTPEEFRRQQNVLNEKIKRLEDARFEAELSALSAGGFDLHLDSDWNDDGGNALVEA